MTHTLKATITFLCLLIPVVSYATPRSVGNTYLKVAGQSTQESTANWIETSVSTSTYCAYNRLYIDFNNKEQFAIAQSAYLNNTQVTIWYEDAATAAVVPPHANISCKVISIYGQ